MQKNHTSSSILAKRTSYFSQSWSVPRPEPVAPGSMLSPHYISPKANKLGPNALQSLRGLSESMVWPD